MMVKLCWRVNDGPVEVETKDCGLLPIMVRVRESYQFCKAENSYRFPAD